MCAPFGIDDIVQCSVNYIQAVLFEITSRTGTLIELHIQCGKECIVLKELLKNSGGLSFTAFAERYIACSIRTLQRYMVLARHLDPKEDKKLFVLGEIRLLALIRLKGDDSIEKYLANNDIFLNFDENDLEEIHFFKEEVQLLIDENSVKSEVSVNKTLSNLKKSLQSYNSKVSSFIYGNSEINRPEDLKKTIVAARNLVQTLQTLSRKIEDE
jgi:hypothetical protein